MQISVQEMATPLPCNLANNPEWQVAIHPGVIRLVLDMLAPVEGFGVVSKRAVTSSPPTSRILLSACPHHQEPVCQTRNLWKR